VVSREHRTNFARRTGIDFADSRGDDALTAGDEYLSLLSLARNSFVDPKSVADRVHLGTSAQFLWFCDVYPRWKKENHLVDFDDMLHRVTPSMLRGDWGALVVDEAQDLNPMQWQIIQTLIEQNDFKQVWVAGDDDQAIYAWAGADAQGMNRFGQLNQAKSEVLSQSYRVPSLVHNVAEGVLARIKQRKAKEYHPRASRGAFEIVTRLEHVKYYDVVLYRNHSIGRQVATELSVLGIPYRSRGVFSPFSSRWGNLVISYLRLINGEMLTAKKIQAIEKASTHKAAYLVQRQFPWQSVFPALPVNLRSDLSLVEARFGPLWKVKPIELTTIHQYKGKEADSVLVVDGMNERTREGFAKDPDSEYRVFYVGVTRAREKLGIFEHDNPLGIGRIR
jgi:superfamily I DNA/RNA helicase